MSLETDIEEFDLMNPKEFTLREKLSMELISFKDNLLPSNSPDYRVGVTAAVLLHALLGLGMYNITVPKEDVKPRKDNTIAIETGEFTRKIPRYGLDSKYMTFDEKVAYHVLKDILAEEKRSLHWSPLLMSINKQESGFDSTAVSFAGAKSWYQVMDKTFKAMGVEGDIFDTRNNTRAGSRYLFDNLSRFRRKGFSWTESKRFSVIAYNMGGSAVDCQIDDLSVSSAEQYIKILKGYIARGEPLIWNNRYKKGDDKRDTTYVAKLREAVGYYYSVLGKENHYRNKIRKYEDDMKTKLVMKDHPEKKLLMSN